MQWKISCLHVFVLTWLYVLWGHMKLTYFGKDASGRSVHGNVVANNEGEAIQLLQSKGVVLTKMERVREEEDVLARVNRYWEGVKTKEVVAFFRQFSALISAKVSILASLRTIQNQTDNPYFRGVIKQISDDVEEGTPLSEGMKKYTLFDSFVISMIRSGEVAGRLDASVDQVADNLESNYELTAKIRGAMLYPSVILLVTVSVGIFVTAYILPKITSIVKDLSGDAGLPWYTEVVMAIGSFMGSYWWAIVIILLGGAAGIWYYINTKDGREEWDNIFIKIPVIGRLASNVYLARFAENLSVLLQGGIPMVQALLIVSDVVNNAHYKEIILLGAENVKKGGVLSETLSRYPSVPPMVTQMVAIGEETGRLNETLKHVSGFYTKETDRMTKNLTSIIEPLLIVILGGGVGFLVLAVLVPIFSLSNVK